MHRSSLTPSASQPPPDSAQQQQQHQQYQVAHRQAGGSNSRRDNWHAERGGGGGEPFRAMQQTQSQQPQHRPAAARRSYSAMSHTQPAAAAAAAAASSHTAGAVAAASANRSMAGACGQQRSQHPQQAQAAAASSAAPAAAPSLDARASKRVRRSPSCKSDAASSGMMAAAAAAAAFPHSTAAAIAAASKEQQEELQCVVCQELPPCSVFQCGNGHLLCKPCHTRVLNESRPSCPVCRTRLSRQRPSRNRFAEGVKSRLRVACTQAGCSELVVFHDLEQHLATQCGYRRAICMYQPLGCDWSGIAIQHQQHENECPIRGMSPRKLLALVHKRNEAHAAQLNAVKKTAQVQTHLCHMLSKRCRDLCVRDLVIERDMSGSMCTKPFKACGLLWEVYLDPPPTNQVPAEVKIHLRIGRQHTRGGQGGGRGGERDWRSKETASRAICDTFVSLSCAHLVAHEHRSSLCVHAFLSVEPLKRKTTIECFCLNGPGLEGADVPPTLRRVVFRRRVTQSESFLLPFNADQSRLIHASDSVSLRLGLLDCSAGVTAATFTTLNLTPDQRQRMEQDAMEEAQSDSDDSDAQIDEDDDADDADAGYAGAGFELIHPLPFDLPHELDDDLDADDEVDADEDGYHHADADVADVDSEMNGELMDGVAGESDGRSSDGHGHGHDDDDAIYDEHSDANSAQRSSGDEGGASEEDDIGPPDEGSDLDDTQPSASSSSSAAAAAASAAAAAAHRSLPHRSPHVSHSMAHSSPSGPGVARFQQLDHPFIRPANNECM